MYIVYGDGENIYFGDQCKKTNVVCVQQCCRFSHGETKFLTSVSTTRAPVKDQHVQTTLPVPLTCEQYPQCNYVINCEIDIMSNQDSVYCKPQNMLLCSSHPTQPYV